MAISAVSECRLLCPNRRLAPWEARSIAERQAHRFHALMRISEPPFPPEAIEYLPRVEVRYLAGLRLSGAIAWRRGKWRVIVNRSDTRGRQRFSLAHELKHLLDHPAQRKLYVNSHYGSAEKAAEGAADYFAACLLMPKSWVKRGFYDEGFRDPAVLARQFEVSVSAMRWRFDQLGLREPERVR